MTGRRNKRFQINSEQQTKRKKSITRSQANFGGYTQLNKNTAVGNSTTKKGTFQILTNYDSTDNQWGYPCWNEDAVTAYLNRKEVQTALNIEAEWLALNATWNDCK